MLYYSCLLMLPSIETIHIECCAYLIVGVDMFSPCEKFYCLRVAYFCGSMQRKWYIILEKKRILNNVRKPLLLSIKGRREKVYYSNWKNAYYKVYRA